MIRVRIKFELKLKLNSAGRALGLTESDLGRQVRQAYYGEEIQRLQRDREELKLMLRYPLQDRKSLSALESLRIRTPEGV